MIDDRFVKMLDGQLSDDESRNLLSSMRGLPVTGEMLAQAASLLRDRMTTIEYPEPLLDTCGTGGDHQCTLNISTAAAFVVAGAGVKVAKHGNRSVSSSSGSSDVLNILGVHTDIPSEGVKACLDEAGIGFCFAPRFHPRLRAMAPIRKQLGFPTIFNLLGPLCNPAMVQRQVMGIGSREYLRPMAEALLSLGVERAAVVHGDPRLDEVSLQGATQVFLISDGTIREMSWSPSDFGFEPQSIESIRCSDASESADQIKRILQNESVPGLPWVLANAAASLHVTHPEKTLSECVQWSQEVVRSGRAYRALQLLQLVSQKYLSSS
ncbi:MAG: anthranilate phosphoribosyltransferase [Planctomycetia bacterium]|nr:anthranilate phosphoribosyltransferase [Planctomycetia bacterium]